MKKTFKKQLVLFAAVMVLMTVAMVMPASAEETLPQCEIHNRADLTPIVYAPTCTQKGYTQWYCETCKQIIIGKPYKEDVTKETGHNYAVSYVLEDGAYKRVRTCTNDMCQRAEGDLPEIRNSVAEDGNAKYYLVEYWNSYALPAEDAADHKEYFNQEFYVKESPSTWISIKYTEEQFFPVGRKVNVDATKAEPESKFEIIDENGELKLYAQDGAALPRYSGLTPKRNKDMTYGRFTFREWVPEISGSKMLCKAEFDYETVDVTATFYDGNGADIFSKTVKYGQPVAYSTEHVYPSKSTDQYNSYTYTNWLLGKDGIRTFGLYDSVNLYFSTDVRPQFASTPNLYTVEIENSKGELLGTGTGVQMDKSIRNIISEANIKDDAFKLPRDKQYIYTQEPNKWQITKVNGKAVSSTVYINSDAFALNRNIYVVDEESQTLKEIIFRGGETITLAPVYKKDIVIYSFTVKIRTNYFAKEDVYDHNSGIVTSDILDKFLITIKDGSGNILAQGTTNKDGECSLNVAYTDTLIFIAQTKNNTKYYGEHTLSLKYSSEESIENTLRNGVSIAPRVTEEWLAGEKQCGCICHSFLSSLVIRIYNILYRIFGIKYVCCDDLFITFGDVLAYTK